MGNNLNNIINTLFIILGWILFAYCAVNLIRNKKTSEKNIRAVITDKQHFTKEMLQKFQPTQNEEKFVLIIKSLDGKRFMFDVSEYTFSKYNIGDRGRLVYCGTKFIDFKQNI